MEIGDTINIVITRSETNFDKACDEAYKRAINEFGITIDGHSDKVIGWNRTSCSIKLIFIEYTATFNEHTYVFCAVAEEVGE